MSCLACNPLSILLPQFNGKKCITIQSNFIYSMYNYMQHPGIYLYSSGYGFWRYSELQKLICSLTACRVLMRRWEYKTLGKYKTTDVQLQDKTASNLLYEKRGL